jgi:Flp pilus assembly protein TadG
MKPLLLGALLLAAGAQASAACPDSMMRDPTFVALAVDENMPRPTSVEDFRFIGDTTTFSQMTAKVGTPDAVKGSRTFLYCLADGTVITVSSNDGTDIKYVRVGSKLIYKRK